MIIYGWRGFTSTNSQGSFYCPTCDSTRPYQQKSSRTWFTLYFFIPVFPISGLTEYIECESCRGTFQLTVLSFDPIVERKRSVEDFRLTLVMLLHQCGRDEHDLPRLAAIFSALFGVETPVDELESDLRHAREADPNIAHTFARRLAVASPEAKMLLLTGAAKVLAFDGSLSTADRSRLSELARDIQCDAAVLDAVLVQTSRPTHNLEDHRS